MARIAKIMGALGCAVLASYLGLSTPSSAWESRESSGKEGRRLSDIVAERGTNDPKIKGEEETSFTKGRNSLQLRLGYLDSPSGIGFEKRNFDYIQLNLRIGKMLSSPKKSMTGIRGNWEGIFEVSNSFITDDYGSYMGGVTLLLRYNLVNPGWKAVPYIQGGAGMVYTDAHKDREQKAIGQAMEFTPQASIGVRYMISDNLSLDVEGMLHHVSNAGLNDRNRGTNAVGAFVGFTYFLDMKKR